MDFSSRNLEVFPYRTTLTPVIDKGRGAKGKTLKAKADKASGDESSKKKKQKPKAMPLDFVLEAPSL